VIEKYHCTRCTMPSRDAASRSSSLLSQVCTRAYENPAGAQLDHGIRLIEQGCYNATRCSTRDVRLHRFRKARPERVAKLLSSDPH